MPRMGGIELAEQLSTLHPELAVLYTSGYGDSGRSLKGVTGARYLQKPCAMEDLARTLRELLDSAHPAPPGGARVRAAATGASVLLVEDELGTGA